MHTHANAGAGEAPGSGSGGVVAPLTSINIDDKAPAKPQLARIRSYTIRRQSSHHWTPPELYYSGPHDAATRNGFLRKVYGIVCAQVLFTTAVMHAMMRDGMARVAATAVSGVWEDRSCSPHILWPGHLTCTSVAIEPFVPLLMPAFAVSLLLTCCLDGFKNTYPYNYVLLAGFTLVEGFTVSFVCVALGIERPEVVNQTFTLTAALFVGLTAFTMQSRIRFNFLGGFLLSSLLLLLAWATINAALGLPFASTAFSLLGALLFSLYVVYDTSMICHRLGYDDCVVAAIELHLGVVNLFLYHMRLLSDDSLSSLSVG
ncbi:hypothetical protein EMIHUDRAFT_204977 [Emiliania huxleyi CCMP1516]|uniref:Uncharacterized protein n=2 Tax=Emiliania huxleyi TaxID=2903 RepID=A0A0D3JU91_EMIH1|nr:hypothetical protein EMIHUDRAFT_204977 [Emiliania huxleyi CCMP1516]EOD27076.1 hypothetical protein EMIHUDRAFT_204977 [Emiliania huxleyi CCMP1516]|eukprot:XP_005779505.1 hypothetical protein EMIHUDRAFT_204977 [Emiliania huxleyi CCMP1516]